MTDPNFPLPVLLILVPFPVKASAPVCKNSLPTPAMKEALHMLKAEDYKKADVIVVSDFIMTAVLMSRYRDKSKRCRIIRQNFTACL
jgi:hypothetical protein